MRSSLSVIIEIRKFNSIPYQSCGLRQNFKKVQFHSSCCIYFELSFEIHELIITRTEIFINQKISFCSFFAKVQLVQFYCAEQKKSPTKLPFSVSWQSDQGILFLFEDFISHRCFRFRRGLLLPGVPLPRRRSPADVSGSETDRFCHSYGSRYREARRRA